MKNKTVFEKFNIKGRVVIITGGAGLFGRYHAEAVIEAGGMPVLLDINQKALDEVAHALTRKYRKEIFCCVADITDPEMLHEAKKKILVRYRRIDALINNAANNPKVEGNQKGENWTQFENFPLHVWQDDVAVSLTGSFLASQVFGSEMAKRGRGVILTISSDLGIIAPDQRIYRKAGLKEEEQMVKPVTYSVVKHGLIGLGKYLATYWAEKGVRVNTLCPGGIYNGQDSVFVKKLAELIPLGRMAEKDEYKAAVLFLISDASSYMTGSTMIIDGGRTCW